MFFSRNRVHCRAFSKIDNFGGSLLHRKGEGKGREGRGREGGGRGREGRGGEGRRGGEEGRGGGGGEGRGREGRGGEGRGREEDNILIISALQFDLTSINAPGIVIQFDHQTNCTVPETAVMRSSY